MGHLLDWYTDPEKFQGEVNLKVIKFIDEITNFPDRDGESGEQIDHLAMIALRQLQNHLPIALDAIRRREGIEIRIHNGRRRNQNRAAAASVKVAALMRCRQKAGKYARDVLFIFP